MTITIYQGDNRLILPHLETGSVHCGATSPPYWGGLRDYDTPPLEWPEVRYSPMPGLPPITIPAQSVALGNEQTPEAYVGHLVLIFREVYRVLRNDGILWLNLNDKYVNRTLTGIPWMVVFALKAEGWHCCSDVIWWKRNAKPEDAPDRPTRDYENIFLLTKRRKYFFDSEAIKEPGSPREPGTMRRRRAVWDIPAKGFKGAHFATFATELAEIFVKSGTSEKGCCPACGAPYKRILEKSAPRPAKRNANPALPYTANGTNNDGCGATTLHMVRDVKTIGWRPTCQCDAGDPVPCTVLDIFGGRGTVGKVANDLGRHAILCELNPDYAQMAVDWIVSEGSLFTDVRLLTPAQQTKKFSS